MLTIVIPCYNESGNIKNLVECASSVVKKNTKIKFIFVDNGSKDDTKVVIKNSLSFHNHPSLQVLYIKKNEGYGGGIMQGLKNATTPYIGWMHADMQTPIDVVNDFQLMIENMFSSKKLFLKGVRNGKRNFKDLFITKGMQVFESILFQMPLEEINAQPTIFHKALLGLAINPPKDFALDLYFFVCAKRNNFEVVRIDVPFKDRQYGFSKWNNNFNNRIKTLFGMVTYSFKLKLDIIKEK